MAGDHLYFCCALQADNAATRRLMSRLQAPRLAIDKRDADWIVLFFPQAEDEQLLMILKSRPVLRCWVIRRSGLIFMYMLLCRLSRRNTRSACCGGDRRSECTARRDATDMRLAPLRFIIKPT